MSLYNMINGVHPLVREILHMLDLTVTDVPRFRDVFIYEDHIRVLTRTGGDNRPEYEEENAGLTRHTDYLEDWDDHYDSTYAWWKFSIPELYAEHAQVMCRMILEHNRHDLMPTGMEEITNRAIRGLQ